MVGTIITALFCGAWVVFIFGLVAGASLSFIENRSLKAAVHKRREKFVANKIRQQEIYLFNKLISDTATYEDATKYLRIRYLGRA